jgi:hypothetical protein
MNEALHQEVTERRIRRILRNAHANEEDIQGYLEGVDDTWDPSVYCSMTAAEVRADYQLYLENRA